MNRQDCAPPLSPLQTLTFRLLSAALILCFLYLGRDLLIPVVMAGVLSFCLIPLVRRLQRLRLHKSLAVIVVVSLFCLATGMSMLKLGTQLARIAASLPHYETTIRDKIRQVDALTLGRLNAVIDRGQHLVGQMSGANAPRPQAVPVVPASPLQNLQDILASVLGNALHLLETTALVLVVLIFILVDYEVFRDRLIRLIGGRNVRRATAAVNEISRKLARFFIAQLTINLATGALIACGMYLLGAPEAFFWGALTAIARFIPYVGTWLAMASTVLVAAAVTPGWSLALAVCSFFIVIELLVSQILEPRLYGHSTGLSPLSVLVGALFWSSLWGPIGLLLSTPLTMCLVVAGRHVPSLHFLELTLGDVPGLSMAEKFYQRALSADPQELIHDLQRYLRTRSLSEYCDRVLIPSMSLAEEDYRKQTLTEAERNNLAFAIGGVIQSLSDALSNRNWRDRLAAWLTGWAETSIGRERRAATAMRVDIVSDGLPPGELNARMLAAVWRQHGVCCTTRRPEDPAPADATHCCFVPSGTEGLEDGLAAALQAAGPGRSGARRLLFRPFSGPPASLPGADRVDEVLVSYRQAADFCQTQSAAR